MKQQVSQFTEKVALVWFILDAFTHLSLELAYVVVTLLYGGANSAPADNVFANVWRIYGKADARWSTYDSTILSMEVLTVFVAGPMALLCVYGLLNKKSWTQLMIAIVSALELYGGFMTFGPEWLARPANPNLTNDPYMLWIFLFFMNALWVWVPAILLFDSCVKINNALVKAKIDKDVSPPSSAAFGTYEFIAFTLVLYAVLVPYAVMTG
jgi:hypothetical protein